MDSKKCRSRNRAHDYSNLTGVVVTAGLTANNLGVIRAFGRRGIPVVYIDSIQRTMVRYSRYITKRLKCPRIKDSKADFIKILLDFGRQIDGQMMIIPTGDREAMALSQHKCELEEFYYLPVPRFETVQNLVNKKKFYELLTKMEIAHPKTYFTESLADLRLIGREAAYPFIVKPAYSLLFQEEFGPKNFVVNSPQELDWAVNRLEGRDLEVMVQEIIPGNEIYAFYTYLNQKSEPLAVCGYDKVRHYPPDFGSGSFCKSSWRSSPVEECIRFLQTIRYHGFAEPELKKDPRDGTYKLLEINARTTLQNRLAAACGVDVEYIAYLDAAGRSVKNLFSFRSDVFWVDDFVDLASCLMLLARKDCGIEEIFKSLKARNVHSVAAWDDPIPLFIHAANLGKQVCLKVFRKLRDLRN